MNNIAIVGEFNPGCETHIATNKAIEHSGKSLAIDVNYQWISTIDIDESIFTHFTGIWVAPGSPYKNMERTLWVIKNARERLIPCFGTCGGFQHIILEYARNVLEFADAHHAEYNPYASNLFISELACSLAGQKMTINFTPDSQVAKIYNSPSTIESYYCNFAINPDKVKFLKTGYLQITGIDNNNEPRIVEIFNHPFFIATLFVPQTRSTAENPHPLISAFIASVDNADN